MGWTPAKPPTRAGPVAVLQLNVGEALARAKSLESGQKNTRQWSHEPKETPLLLCHSTASRSSYWRVRLELRIYRQPDP
jgi:hypothetical protein